MVIIQPPLPALSAESLSLFYATDDLLSSKPALIFYGTSATTTALPTNSRIQVHIFTAAGFQSFPRLIVSPNSPLYTAVTCLAREEQGDEICRGLAFSLYKYFSELSDNVKDAWSRQFSSTHGLSSAPKPFSGAHAAILASRMTKVENMEEVLEDVKQILAQQSLSWIDIDVVMPPGSMKAPDVRESGLLEDYADSMTNQRYGQYAPIVKLLGESSFLPTSRLRRAPSRPTATNRTHAFTKRQKECLRREMIELLDTEESYVGKIYDLLHNVAEDFRQKARKKSFSSASPSEQALQGLFPPSLDKILQVNTSFLDALRGVLDETEDDAIKDLESMDENESLIFQPTEKDVTGVALLARCLLEWFPKFSDCYSQYIQAHTEFSKFLKIFLKETGSSFSRRIQETGEQRLMSMLIEPVQRLPRYNLYVDNIIKQLPVRHPAFKQLLKARDMVSEICSRESIGTDQAKTMFHLKRCVTSLPPDFRPSGRLISAIDVTELAPPYRVVLQSPSTTPGILLLFSNCLVELRKSTRRATTARALLSELDGSGSNDTLGDQSELVFHQALRLDTLFATELNDGRMLQLNTSSAGPSSPHQSSIRIFNLSLAYEGKAAKFVEELTRAKVEGRFSENERESFQWDVRQANGDLTLFSALFEETSPYATDRLGHACVRVLIDPEKHPDRLRPGESDVELVVTVARLKNELYLLEMTGVNDYVTRDQLTAADFQPVLNKRISNFFQMRNQMRNPSMTITLLLRNALVLSSLRVKTQSEVLETEEANDRIHRPTSPVKLLSNLFSSGSLKESSSPRKTKITSSIRDGPRLLPTPSSRPQSRDSDLPSRPQSSGMLVVGSITPNSRADTLSKLEDTLFAYYLALHSRKGNVVGRNLRARALAEELHVNELYNSLLEDSSNLHLAAQSPVDVLFAAFEKFVKIAWKDRMGPIISHSTLISVQSKSDSAEPQIFEDFFRKILAELPPQNQRALHGMIRLLADLLEGTGNDADRGTLTASFAEVLVTEGNSHDFISLLDRFVEDSDVLFGLQVTQTPGQGSMSSESRYRPVANTPSISSNASSLRKKFGLASLSRENSKAEHESKLGSVLRTLSKTKVLDNDRSGSASKGKLVRSNSTDLGGRMSPSRPKSRDRPTVIGAFAWEDDSSHSGRSFLQNSSLDPIGEVPLGIEHPGKKKRRSSLSDLKPLHMSAHNTPTWSPATPRCPGHARQLSASPLTSTPTKSSLIPGPLAVSPLAQRALPVPGHKDNFGTIGSRQQNSSRKLGQSSVEKDSANLGTDEVTITSRAPTKRRGESISGIPMLKSPTGNPPVLSERISSGNVPKLPVTTNIKTGLAPSSVPPKKLRMQSPQKLRERLQKEQKAVSTASNSLQVELSKIGDEIAASAALGHSSGSVRGARSNTIYTPVKSSTAHMSPSAGSLVGRVTTLESRLTALTNDLTARAAAIEADLRSSLDVSETRARKLDELYKESNAENEALYGKFNDELARIVNRVRGGEGLEELKMLLKQSQDEVAVLKRDNGRLKRENVGLRAQLRE